MHHCVTHACKKPESCKCRFMRQTSVPVIWLIGGVGSGKKTVGSALAEQFNMTFISGGDLLRDVSMSRSDRAPDILKKLQDAMLVDDEVIVELLENRMKSTYKSTQGFVLSFVKNTNQAELFERFVAPVDLVLYLDCTEAVMLQRANERLATMPEIDDNPETIIRRIEQFTATIKEILKQYKAKVKRISADADREKVLSKAVRYVAKAKAVKQGEEPRSNVTSDEDATTLGAASVANNNPNPNP